CSSPRRCSSRSRAAGSAGSRAPGRRPRSAATRSRPRRRRSLCCSPRRCWSLRRSRWPGRSLRFAWRSASIPCRCSVADARTVMEVRLLWASLWRRRGTASLAALAVAIGASVAAALMHVSGDVGAKLTRELRSLGPNLLLAPSPASLEPYLDATTVRARLAEAHVNGMPVLYATAHVYGHAIPIAGADLDALVRMHPSWKRSGATTGAQAGAAL